MKLKQIMTVGLSAAMILAAVPGETVVFADAEQEAEVDFTEAEADAENVEMDETAPEIVDNETVDVEIPEEAEVNEETETSESVDNTENFDSADTFTDGDDTPAVGEIVQSGTVYGDVTWTLDSNGNLDFEGAGELYNSGGWYNLDFTNVTIGENITSIYRSTFLNKDCMKSVTIKGKNVSIGKFAFYGCSNLENLNITGSISEIGECGFNSCSKLTNVTIPGSISNVGDESFRDCTALESISFPDGVENIGVSAFVGASKLTNVTISRGSTKLDNNAFFGCSNLQTIDSADGIIPAGEYALHRTGIKSVKISPKTSNIGKMAFYLCEELESVEIPGSVKEIGDSAFESCSKLTKITMKPGVEKIDAGAFSWLPKLDTIIIPKTVTTVGSFAFAGVRNTKNVYYGGTQAQWEALGISSFFPKAEIIYNYVEAHEHQYVYKVTKPTCASKGKQTGTCTICGDTVEKEIPALGHKFSSWKTTKAATVFAPAVQTRTCSVCNRKETRNYGKKLAATIKVNVTSLPLKTKQKTTVLKVKGLAKGDAITGWKSNNTKVVKVAGRSNGTCTLTAGSKIGKATVTVILKSGLKKNITVTVQKSDVKTTKITGIAKSLNLKINQAATLKAAVTPITSLQKVTYKSSNTKVATVTSKGVVKAKKKGTAVITVKSGSKTVKCKVTVR